MTQARRSTPTEATILRGWAQSLKAETRVGLIGEVTAYDSASRLATVQPVMKEQDGETIPPLRDVRVGCLRAGPFTISLPVAIGDIVEVRFLDVSHDAFIADGSTGQTPDARRRHDLSDAVAIPLALGPETLPNASATDLVIGTASGVGTVSVAPSGQVTVTSGDIRLGSTGAADPVVLLGELNTYLGLMNVAIATAAPGYAAPGPLPTGATKEKGE